MENYYKEKLNSAALFRAYDTKIDRVTQFLGAEIEFIRNRLSGSEHVLELGAGYGRIMREMSDSSGSVTGVDISEQSVALAREYLKDCRNCSMICENVHNLDFETTFDVILCLQNGLSAIKGGTTESIVLQSMKFLRAGGTAYFSSYSPKFWNYRLQWFQEQADMGLIGEIDYEKTKNGCIICKDGFVARTVTVDEFEHLGRLSGHEFTVTEHDDSLVFLIIRKPL